VPATRVLIADDHPIYVDGLAAAIERTGDLELVAKCRDGAEALERISADGPDVAVLDLRMPHRDAPDVLEELADGRTCRVLVLSVHVGPGEVHECVSLGAAGYLAKDTDRAEICDAIRAVAQGRIVLSAEAQAAMAAELRQRRAAEREHLSTREREILDLLARGASAPDIAAKLYLSTATVKTHLHNLYRKLDVSDRAAAVAEGMRRGLIR
jgi:two-component system, NarL family, nitrate/nitrite response regulator NarL